MVFTIDVTLNDGSEERFEEVSGVDLLQPMGDLLIKFPTGAVALLVRGTWVRYDAYLEEE